MTEAKIGARRVGTKWYAEIHVDGKCYASSGPYSSRADAAADFGAVAMRANAGRARLGESPFTFAVGAAPEPVVPAGALRLRTGVERRGDRWVVIVRVGDDDGPLHDMGDFPTEPEADEHARKVALEIRRRHAKGHSTPFSPEKPR